MESRTLRSVLSIVEILLGVGLILIAVYSLWLNRNCPPDGLNCSALGALSAFIFSINGFLLLGVGVISYYWRRLPLVVIQVPFAVALFAFYVWLMDY
jgi:hypothetical protein